ncbi:MAG: glycosyltransferase family 2 protein [Acetobacteraceae bacterium]
MGRLAICAIFKNEASYLLEWIAYPRAIGFDHIVLYDNASTDGGAALIRSSWAASCTTVIP